MTKIEPVLSLFNQGFNCTQALLATYGKRFGLNREAALKIGTPFGGGMGRMGKTCGAVTGAFMLIGLKYGVTTPDSERKIKAYELVEKFVEKFTSDTVPHSIVCSELLGFSFGSLNELSEDKYRIIQEKCPGYVRKAAEIIEEIL
jgi:C_GCAxxG_C_C family probable redox protein